MKEFNQDAVSKRFRQLPIEVREVILSDEIAFALLGAMQNAGLTQEKMKECNEQATLVLVGLSTTKEFREYTHGIFLDEDKAQTLFDTVSTQVFIPVRDSLLKAFDQNRTPETAKNTNTDPYREAV